MVASATYFSQVSLLHHQAPIDGESCARRDGTSPGNFSSIAVARSLMLSERTNARLPARPGQVPAAATKGKNEIEKKLPGLVPSRRPHDSPPMGA